jgi:hypothetical protein
MFGPKRGEVAGRWKKVHNEKLHALFSSPNSRHGEMKSAYKTFVRKSEQKRSLGRPRCRG